MGGVGMTRMLLGGSRRCGSGLSWDALGDVELYGKEDWAHGYEHPHWWLRLHGES